MSFKDQKLEELNALCESNDIDIDGGMLNAITSCLTQLETLQKIKSMVSDEEWKLLLTFSKMKHESNTNN